MTSSRCAYMLVAEPAARDAIRTSLEGRHYEVRLTDRAGLLEALRAGQFSVFTLGRGGLSVEEIKAVAESRILSMARPALALISRGECHLVPAVLAAGVTNFLLTPMDPIDLEAELTLEEHWGAERARLHDMLAALPDLIGFYDAAGRLRFANHRRSGTIDDVLVSPTIDQLPDEVRDDVVSAFRRALEGMPGEIEVERGGMSCRVRAVPFGSPPGGVALIGTDVTHYRRIEEELRSSHLKAQAMLEAIPDMMFRVDTDGVFLDFRAETVDRLVVPPDQIVGRRVDDVLPAPIARQIHAAMAAAEATGSSQRFEYQLTTPAGTHDYECRFIQAGPRELVAMVRDITESKRLGAQLALADRLAALGTLAAGVAHEINNPLTYILIGIESVVKELKRKQQEDAIGERLPVLLERLQGAIEGARRVRRIVSDLRTLSRADDEEMRPVDVRVLLDSVAAMVDSQVRYRARLIKEYGKDVPAILGNQDRLGQVFVNLLLNAAQALPESTASENYIRLRTSTDGRGRVVVEVADSGQGIPPEDLSRIFDPFFTTKPVGVGTGLGLWICHTIVTSFGGEITATSTVGDGTSFRIVLPAAELSSGWVDDRADEDLPPGELGRILIIDDDRQVQSSLAILFEGRDLTVVSSGNEGLRRLLAGDDFDLVFCDLMMPDLSGIEVYEQVKRVRPALAQRFVFMTGGAFTPRAREFVSSIENPCLTKPFHPRQVARALRQKPRG